MTVTSFGDVCDATDDSPWIVLDPWDISKTCAIYPKSGNGAEEVAQANDL